MTDGFSAAERAAMKERAAELRAEGKKGAKKVDGLQAVLDRIASMTPEDRALAERVHVTVTTAAPGVAFAQSGPTKSELPLMTTVYNPCTQESVDIVGTIDTFIYLKSKKSGAMDITVRVKNQGTGISSTGVGGAGSIA